MNKRNPLSDVMEEAESIVQRMETSLMEEFGLPLFVDAPRQKVTWPDDPEAMTPEEMAVLVQTRGQDAVNQWLAEFYSARADQEQFLGEGE